MAERIDREELRQLIREALKEALATRGSSPVADGGGDHAKHGGGGSHRRQRPAFAPSTAFGGPLPACG